MTIPLTTRRVHPARGWLGAACTTLLTLLVCPLAAAQPWTVPATVTQLPGEVDLTVVDGKLELSLEDALELALQRNLSIQVQRYARAQAYQGIGENLGIYDLDIDGSVSASSSSSKSSTSLELTGGTKTTDQDQASFGLSQLTRFGGSVSVTFDSTRRQTNDRADTINPLYTASLRAGFNQPLLRNFGRTVTQRPILLAHNQSAISHDQFELQVTGVVQQVSDGYWDLIEAREQLQVSEESLRLAKELHEMNRIQVEVGTMAPLEMVTSEAGVATREEEIIRLQAAVDDAADRLRRLLNLEQGDLWDAMIVPVTEPEAAGRVGAIDFQEAYRTALEERPELRSQRLENRSRELDARFFHNQVRPRLDLSGGYGRTGAGGTVRIIDRTTGEILQVFPGGYSDAIDEVVSGDFDGWQLQLTFAYPLQNRTAKARSARAELAVDQGEAQLQDLEQQILIEVRSAARGVETTAKQIDSAKVSSKLAQKNLEAEQKRYENGLSTSFQVLQIQEELAQARSREVSAVIAYRKAVVAYQQSIGRLLEETGVELVDGEDGS